MFYTDCGTQNVRIALIDMKMSQIWDHSKVTLGKSWHIDDNHGKWKGNGCIMF